MAASASATRRMLLETWAGAPRMGQPITGFLALKAPIDFHACGATSLSADDQEEHEFSVSMFMERQQADGRLVGLVIDLTSAQPDGRRLYDTGEWSRDWDVEYVSIPVAPPLPEADADADAAEASAAWAEPVPSEAQVATFIDAASAFWRNPRNQRMQRPHRQHRQ